MELDARGPLFQDSAALKSYQDSFLDDGAEQEDEESKEPAVAKWRRTAERSNEPSLPDHRPSQECMMEPPELSLKEVGQHTSSSSSKSGSRNQSTPQRGKASHGATLSQQPMVKISLKQLGSDLLNEEPTPKVANQLYFTETVQEEGLREPTLKKSKSMSDVIDLEELEAESPSYSTF